MHKLDWPRFNDCNQLVRAPLISKLNRLVKNFGEANETGCNCDFARSPFLKSRFDEVSASFVLTPAENSRLIKNDVGFVPVGVPLRDQRAAREPSPNLWQC